MLYIQTVNLNGEATLILIIGVLILFFEKITSIQIFNPSGSFFIY